MSAPSAGELIDHIREAAQQSCLYVEGLAREDFMSDRRTQQAVILNLIIIGEAATKLMTYHAAAVAALPDVPWQSMRGMRNRIAHGYYDIDLDTVWETVSSSLPDLITALGAGKT